MRARRIAAVRAAGAAVLAALLAVAAGYAEPAEPAGPRPRAALPRPRTEVAAGIGVSYPRSWRLLAPRITALAYPAERLLLTSYRTRRGGNCGPDRAERDLPAGGALVYLIEYRPRQGDVWAHLRRRDFPRRPAHFALRSADLAGYECWRVPSYLMRFRAADRPFQLHVALGRRATAARRSQVLRILDSLRFARLPAPPPDPYAGWASMYDETGDSLRTPPGWSAGLTTGPRRYARPRALFFTSNRRLAGVPVRRARRASRLPRPFPAAALDALPDDGVLLWVREEPKGPSSDAFPAFPRRRWPDAADFGPWQEGPAARWPGLRWERAAAQEHGHRFSVWIISGRGASERDRALAVKSAGSLALSTGDFRDAACRRACRQG